MEQGMSVLTSHATAEWNTPRWLIDLVREVLGGIDLDPASNELAQSWIQAGQYIDKRSDGLTQDWVASRIFLNPPYGKDGGSSNQATWSAKMVAEYQAGHFEQGVLLINSTHGYKYFEALWTAYPVCCLRERVRFIKPDGTQGGQAKRGQALLFFGQDPTKFIEVFKPYGRIIMPEASI